MEHNLYQQPEMSLKGAEQMGPMCRIGSPAAALSSWVLVRAQRAGYLPHSKDPTGFLSLAANAATVPSARQPVPICSCPIHWKRRFFRDLQSSVGSWPSIRERCRSSRWPLNARPSLWAATTPTSGAELKYPSPGKWPGGRAGSPWHRGQTDFACHTAELAPGCKLREQ